MRTIRSMTPTTPPTIAPVDESVSVGVMSSVEINHKLNNQQNILVCYAIHITLGPYVKGSTATRYSLRFKECLSSGFGFRAIDLITITIVLYILVMVEIFKIASGKIQQIHCLSRLAQCHFGFTRAQQKEAGVLLIYNCL